MPIKVVDPDTGVETEAFTAAEVETQKKEIEEVAAKKIADNEAHLATKLDEFQKGRQTSALETEAEKQKREADVTEAKRIADEALATARGSEERRVAALKKSAIERYVGTDPEMTKKMEEAWAIIGIDTKEDVDFFKKAEAAANMSGLNAAPHMAGGMPFGGGFAPNLQPKKAVDEAAHTTFRGALPGMDDFLAKPKDDQK